MRTNDHQPPRRGNLRRRTAEIGPRVRQLTLGFEEISLASLASQRLWVAWRFQKRGENTTKIPLDPSTGRPARSNGPSTWGTRDEAEVAIERISEDSRGGVGIQLADLGNGERLGGIDLDTCRDPNTGQIANWARKIIDKLATYAEISPSRTGVKLYFRFRAASLSALRAEMGSDHGKVWQRRGGEHPPAIELHLGNRYFAVTDEQLDGVPATIEAVSQEALLQLIRETGPAFKENVHQTRPNKAPLVRRDTTIEHTLQRLEQAAASSIHLRSTLDRIDQYGSRSEAAMALGSALKGLGWSLNDMSAALHAHPATASWAEEKGDTAGGRELRRIYDRAQPNDPDEDTAPWGEPDFGIARLNRRPPPEFPLHVFGDAWSNWIRETADAAAAAPDYVAANLLAAASGLIGNARWAEATPGWAEPPHLWCATVGDSGTSKSAAADILVRNVLPELERRMIGDFPDRLAEWRTKFAEARAAKDKWNREFHAASKKNTAPPLPPPEMDVEEPHAPCICMSDVTIEKVATILAHAAPKGLIIQRDELSGWLLGLNNYNDAGREFWIEAFGGRPYRVARQKLQEPIIVPRLSVTVMGSTQPSKVAQMLRQADDGLLARFLWFWPELRPFQLSRQTPRIDWAVDALDRLRLLEMQTSEHGQAIPINVPLAREAMSLMESFAQKRQLDQQEAGEWMKSALGKARGVTLRLSLVLEMLKWCGCDGFVPPPSTISVETFVAATRLFGDYLMPMAERVYGDASTTAEQRNASTLARWIMKTKAETVHVRTLQRDIRLPGLSNAAAIRAAADVLVEADWLRPPERGSFQRRATVAYRVNPRLNEQ